MIFPLITFPYTSRILGPAGIGKINFASSFMGYFILFASIGIPMYGIREIARVREDKDKLSNVAQELFVMHLLFSLLTFICFLLLIFLNDKIHEEKALFFVFSFAIVLTSLGLNWLYQGLEDYIYITVRTIVFSTISTISIFIFIHSKDDYLVSGIITVVAASGSSLLNFYNSRKIIFKKRASPWEFKRHLKPMGMVYGMTFIGSLYLQLDTIMLGFMSKAKNIGYYTGGMKLTKLLMGLIISFSDVLVPRLSYYVANNLKDEFDSMITKSFSIIFLITIPTVIAMIMLSKEIILFFAGDQYLPAVSSLIITAPILIFIGVTYILGLQVLYPLGKDKQMVISFSLAAVTSLILNLFLIPTLAHIGAAISTLVAEFVVLIAQLFMIRNIYKPNLPLKSIYKYLISSLTIVLAIVLVQKYISLIWLRLLIVVPSGIFLYFGCLILLKEKFVFDVLSTIKNKVFSK